MVTGSSNESIRGKKRRKHGQAYLSIRAAVIKALQSPVESSLLRSLRQNDPRPGIECIIAALVSKAAEGDVNAMKEIREYLKLKKQNRSEF